MIKKTILLVAFLFGVVGCEEDRPTQAISGKVIRLYQVASSFVAQTEYSGPHAIVESGTTRYNIAGEETAKLMVGDSITATVTLNRTCVGCPETSMLVRSITVLK